MNAKTRYLLSLLCLAIFVAMTTAFVQHKRVERAEAQQVENEIALLSEDVDVKNIDQIRQIAIIRQQLQKKQPLSDEQIDQLVKILNGPPDQTLQTRATTLLLGSVRLGSLSPSQKTKIADAGIRALKNPEVAVRRFSISLLGRLEEQRAVPVLLPLLNDPEEGVRRSTKKALERLQKPAPTPRR